MRNRSAKPARGFAAPEIPLGASPSAALALAELRHALEQVLTATEGGHAQAAIPVLDAGIAQAFGSHDREVIQIVLGAQMARNALREGRTGAARRYAGATLHDIERRAQA